MKPILQLATIVTILSLFLSNPCTAQKPRPAAIPKDIQKKISEVVKPITDQVDLILKGDKTGTYKAWVKEVQQLAGYKSNTEKMAAANKLKEKYESFFASVWAKAKVDEPVYQQRIRDLFPAALREKMKFDRYLNFSIDIDEPANTPPAPPPAPAPKGLPENKCIDVCSIAVGDVNGGGGLIAGGNGSYGNCFIKANAWSAVAGKNDVTTELKNNITIPGTLPSDARKLRIKLSFQLTQEATAITILGTSTSLTSVTTFKGKQELFVAAPVLWAANQTRSKTYSEEYVINKTDIARSIIKSFAECVSVLSCGTWCHTDCTNIKWSVCEE